MPCHGWRRLKHLHDGTMTPRVSIRDDAVFLESGRTLEPLGNLSVLILRCTNSGTPTKHLHTLPAPALLHLLRLLGIAGPLESMHAEDRTSSLARPCARTPTSDSLPIASAPRPERIGGLSSLISCGTLRPAQPLPRTSTSIHGALILWGIANRTERGITIWWGARGRLPVGAFHCRHRLFSASLPPPLFCMYFLSCRGEEDIESRGVRKADPILNSLVDYRQRIGCYERRWCTVHTP
ncbi:hypothetical protein FB451DRAFT_1550701 [Mycena latifolia]|nr:hypothetical protein FB451DRAFT_1550701 [Mycena latifolia]